MTIKITDLYVVDPDSVIKAVDDRVFRLDAGGADSPILDNRGAVILKGAQDGATLAMTYVSAGSNGEVHNEAGASMVFTAKGEGETAFGVQYAGGGTLNNEGLLQVESRHGDAVGVMTAGFISATSSGDISVRAEGDAIGVRLADAGDFTNHGGKLTVIAGGLAIGAELLGDTDMQNAGVMRVTGGAEGAIGVSYSGFRTIDTTDLIVRSVGGQSIGVAVHANDNPDATVWVENNGLLRADIAVLVDPGAGAGKVMVVNWVKMVGDVLLADGDDVVSNEGRLYGEVHLGAGVDVYAGERGEVSGTVYGGAGGDGLYGGKGAEVLIGDGDSATGAGGDDMLQGGRGADTLTGGDGADLFIYQHVADSTVTTSDLITDLQGDDRISLEDVDADKTHQGDQAFHLVEAFSGAAGELTVSYDAGRDLTLVQGDVDGDGVADLVITASGDHHDFTNFVL